MSLQVATRSCIRNVTPYSPGKPIAEVRRELGLGKVVKLASNENFLGPSPKALACLRAEARECHLYPEGASPLLRRAFARRFGMEESRVIVGNGSDELLRLLCETLLDPEDEVVVSQYGFIRFKQHAALMGAKVIEVPMADWTHDLRTMGRAVSARTKLVFVASPNNPTGTYSNREEVLGLLKALPARTLLVLDEAYYDYASPRADYPQSLPGLARRYANLVVLRTLSKAYGLAGLRIGLAVADPELVGWMDRARLPFNVSLPAQRAALAALEDTAFLKRSVAAVEENRGELASALERLGFFLTESSANFLFARGPLPGKTLFERLLRRGVIVRPLDEYGLPQHLRVSVGSRAQNRILLKALRAALEAP